MIPPFEQHPLIQQYNQIKKYFRRHETSVSRQRIRAFRHYCQLVQESQSRVAFDFTGSLNFGMSTERSDVDLVLYLECDRHFGEECLRGTCHRYDQLEETILDQVRKGPEAGLEVQVVDCINLKTLDQELVGPELESSILVRFAFYRSVCRAVNARLLRPFHQKLRRNPELVRQLQPELFAIFDELARSMQHQLSMNKYRERLADTGVLIPGEVQVRIREHLQHYGDRTD